MNPETTKAYRTWRKAADKGYGETTSPIRMRQIDTKIVTLKNTYERLLRGEREYERGFWESRKAAFIDSTHAAMMADHAMLRRYAYVKPSALGVWGELANVPEGTDPPAGFELVTAEHIPSGPKGQIRAWFERFAGKLPVFPMDVQS